MMSALTTAQNFLRVSIPEATDVTKATRPSHACARRLPCGFRFTTVALLFFQKFFIYPTPDDAPYSVGGAKLKHTCLI